jgi:hypothetical protein
MADSGLTGVMYVIVQVVTGSQSLMEPVNGFHHTVTGPGRLWL